MDTDIKATLENGLAELSTRLGDTMKKYDEELEKFGKADTKLTGEIDALSSQFKEIRDELADLAQKQVHAANEAVAFETAGAQFVKSDAYKALAEGRVERARTQVKATIVSDNTTTMPTQRQGVIGGNFAPLTVRQLIPTVNVTGNSVTSLREVDWTNAAAETAQGALKPESELTLEPYNVPIETVAHWVKISNQLLADAPAVRAYIDTRLRDGLAQRIERQIILGDGTAPNLSGLTDAGNFTAYTPTAADNLVDAINRAKYERWAAGEVVDTVIVNPADWSNVVLMREGAGTGQYLFGAPGTDAGMNPFGLNLVLSPHMPAGSFIVANLRGSATIFQREGATIEMGFVNDDFIRNLVTIRAEERLGLAVDRPAGILYGEFTTTE